MKVTINRCGGKKSGCNLTKSKGIHEFPFFIIKEGQRKASLTIKAAA